MRLLVESVEYWSQPTQSVYFFLVLKSSPLGYLLCLLKLKQCVNESSIFAGLLVAGIVGLLIIIHAMAMI